MWLIICFLRWQLPLKTYFQKIAAPKDIASTAGVSFTINHIAAVVIPALLGLIWIVNESWVFFIGAAFAFGSLILSLLVPNVPKPGNEWRRMLGTGPTTETASEKY